jgi:hypothetical protein
MRIIAGAIAFSLLAATPALAQQQYAIPRGSYERSCTDIQMQGQFLSATCRGTRGGGQSSINVLSCGSDISVDPDGGLICAGPAVNPNTPPIVRDPPRGYDPGADYRGDYRRDRNEAASLFGGRGFRGRPLWIYGPTPNLARIGLNDQVQSIHLERGSGPWLVCTDANYRGRCTTIRGSVDDVGRIGMRNAISSLRPAY